MLVRKNSKSSIIFPIKDKCQHEIQAFISKDDKRGLKQKEQKKKNTEKYKCTRLVM